MSRLDQIRRSVENKDPLPEADVHYLLLEATRAENMDQPVDTLLEFVKQTEGHFPDGHTEYGDFCEWCSVEISNLDEEHTTWCLFAQAAEIREEWS